MAMMGLACPGLVREGERNRGMAVSCEDALCEKI